MISKTIKTTLINTLVISLILLLVFFPNPTYSFGLILGSLASLLALIILDYRISRVKVERLKTALIYNRLVRFGIYIIAFITAYFNQNLFSIITTIIGLFMIKLSLLMLNIFKPQTNRVKR